MLEGKARDRSAEVGKSRNGKYLFSRRDAVTQRTATAILPPGLSRRRGFAQERKEIPFNTPLMGTQRMIFKFAGETDRQIKTMLPSASEHLSLPGGNHLHCISRQRNAVQFLAAIGGFGDPWRP